MKYMLISIGSRSIPKVTAITRAFSRYPELWLENDGKIESGVSCNPLSLEETINGAKNRAKNAFEHAEERCRHM